MDVFISYDYTDAREIAHELHDELDKIPHVNLLMQKKADETWSDEMNEAIGTCDFVMILVSKALNAKLPTPNLIQQQFQAAQKHSKVLIPVILEDTDIPPRLAALQHYDLRINQRAEIRKIAAEMRDRSGVKDAVTVPMKPLGFNDALQKLNLDDKQQDDALDPTETAQNINVYVLIAALVFVAMVLGGLAVVLGGG